MDTLCGAIPVVLRIGEVQTDGPNFNMVILGRTGRTLVRRWGNVWEYRYTGVSSPMLLPITEAWCIEYTLLFDPQKVLRYWLRKDCGQSLDLNSASANELRTLPGLRGVDVSRIIAGRPYQSRDELLTRKLFRNLEGDQRSDQCQSTLDVEYGCMRL